MERVFSVDEMSDSFWAAAAGLPSPAAGGRPRGLMNRSPSEWYFEKFLEVAEEEAAIPRTTPPSPANPNLDPDYNRNPPPASAVASNSSGGGRKDGGRGGEDELVEIKEPAVVAAAAPPQGPPSDPPADVDPKEYVALLKQRLDLYCAAVATCRVKPYIFVRSYVFSLCFKYLLLLFIFHICLILVLYLIIGYFSYGWEYYL